VELLQPGLKLDLGGIAKGFAAQEAQAVLKAHGIDRALVAAAGDIVVTGPPPGRDGWRVGIAPLDPTQPPGRILIVANAAVSTSGDAERFVVIEGKRYGHIIDPRTGYPGREVLSATVVHEDGSVADAAATALVVAGMRDWQRIARQMGLKLVMVVDQAGEVHMPPAMADRVRFAEDSPPKVHVMPPL
jgi:thiamine biosynthesis lipoprotein